MYHYHHSIRNIHDAIETLCARRLEALRKEHDDLRKALEEKVYEK